MADHLKGVKASNKPRSEENCTYCGQQGHSEYNCWGICPACEKIGHRPGTCQLSPDQIRSRENKRKRKLRLVHKKRRLKRKLDKNQPELNLPEDESNSKFWADSLSDGETVIDMNNTEDSTDESSEDETSEEVKTVKEVMGDASVNDIISAIEKIKIAKENDNSAQGLVSKNTDFRQAREEKFMFDSGAQVCIMGGDNGSGK